ncbi:MAG: hypothetical protein C4K48_11895 [Candidatus Thorarchaeota archaeon]|nr:MAG: hypothetical protein C4K48_11895 [Candidatus Thorarchaeota archaeon]
MELFDNLEDNYPSWHPKDHVSCRSIKGRPHEVGSVAHFEEALDGKPFKIRVKTTKVERYEYSENEPYFPLSIFPPKGAYIFEAKGGNCVFTAINHFRIPRLFRKSFLAYTGIEALRAYIKDEGLTLKNLPEKQRCCR